MVSLCQLWQALGQQRTIGPFACLEIHHSGFLQLGFWADRLGTGAITVRGDLRGGDDFNTALVFHVTQNESLNIPNLVLCQDKLLLGTRAPVDTDLVYIRDIVVLLASLN